MISSGPLSPRAASQSLKQRAAAADASPSGQGRMSSAVASSPAAATSANRAATRPTCPSASAGSVAASQLAHVLAQRLGRGGRVVGDLLEEGAGGVPRVGLAGPAQVVGQRGAAGEAVQRVEDAQALAGVGRDVDHAHRLAGAGTLARLGDLVGEAQLAGAEEQDAPGRDLARPAGAGGAALPGAVAQHVGHGVDRARPSAWLTSSSRCSVSQAPAAVASAALSVVRQLPSAQPQVERAACRAEVLPIDEPPRKWKPPDSWPGEVQQRPGEAGGNGEGEAAVADGRGRDQPLPLRRGCRRP